MAVKRRRIRRELFWVWSGEVLACVGAFVNQVRFIVFGFIICITAIIFWIGD